MNYRVKWEIDIEAGSPQEAANRALEIHRDPESTATLFEVEGRTELIEAKRPPPSTTARTVPN